MDRHRLEALDDEPLAAGAIALLAEDPERRKADFRPSASTDAALRIELVEKCLVPFDDPHCHRTILLRKDV